VYAFDRDTGDMKVQVWFTDWGIAFPLLNVVDTRTHKSVYSDLNANPFATFNGIYPRYLHDKVTVQLSGAGGYGRYLLSKSFSLGTLYYSPSHRIPLFRAPTWLDSLPALTGNSQEAEQDYPGDWYANQLSLGLYLPRDLAYRWPVPNGKTFIQSQGMPVDVHSYFAFASGIHGLQSKVSALPLNSSWLRDVRLTVATSPSNQLFVYVTAGIPLMISFVALLLLLGSTSANALPLDVGVGLAVGVFAVLPIRAVVVPTAITTLTRVDYMLGLAIAVAASVLLLGCAGRLRNQSDAGRKVEVE
jgi:hypothetical protein